MLFWRYNVKRKNKMPVKNTIMQYHINLIR